MSKEHNLILLSIVVLFNSSISIIEFFILNVNGSCIFWSSNLVMNLLSFYAGHCTNLQLAI
jgi:hypothetical protein